MAPYPRGSGLLGCEHQKPNTTRAKTSSTVHRAGWLDKRRWLIKHPTWVPCAVVGRLVGDMSEDEIRNLKLLARSVLRADELSKQRTGIVRAAPDATLLKCMRRLLDLEAQVGLLRRRRSKLFRHRGLR